MVAGRRLDTWEIHLQVANFRCEASPSKGARGSKTLNTHTQSDAPSTPVMYSSFIPAGFWDCEPEWHRAPGCVATRPWAFCWCKSVNKGYLMKLKRAPSLLCLMSFGLLWEQTDQWAGGKRGWGWKGFPSGTVASRKCTSGPICTHLKRPRVC